MTPTVAERPQVLSADTLKNETVVSLAGENLGNIKDYMIDLDTGCIGYCVLSFGGVLGLGEKLFAVPWPAMTLDTDRHRFILDVDKERLKKAPGFDKDEWPGAHDRVFQSEVYSFYNIRPYWK